MRAGALLVQRARAGENQKCSEVRYAACHGHHQHDRAVDNWRREEPLACLYDNYGRNSQEQETICVCGQWLITTVPIRTGSTRRSSTDADRDDRKDERAAVGQHVGRFGQQGNGVRPESADPFDDREATEHHERNPQALLTGVFATVMMMSLIVAVAGGATVVVFRGHARHAARIYDPCESSWDISVGPLGPGRVSVQYHRSITAPWCCR